jgi:hypothetical protein
MNSLNRKINVQNESMNASNLNVTNDFSSLSPASGGDSGTLNGTLAIP